MDENCLGFKLDKCRHWDDPLSSIIKTATPHLPTINSMQLRTMQSGLDKTEVQQLMNKD